MIFLFYILFADVRFFLEQLVTDGGCTVTCLSGSCNVLYRRGEFVIAYAPPAVEVPLGAPPCVGLVGVGEE